ncbi:hypothetical protein E2C01_049326 [Portunus trituberculatus]|uniref:Uncharacterized protein n=1 Tax=Portunus trituberculatus TaxID=210409 RepID=A0A5B7G637_PORTR|nr:hypothetical protein [Portunus trituberculatus]
MVLLHADVVMPRSATLTVKYFLSSLHKMETDTFHSAVVSVRTEGKRASTTGSVGVMDTVETASDMASCNVGLAALATVAENKVVVVKVASC